MQTFETFDLIREAMDYANDQLKAFAEWLDRASEKEKALRRDVITQLQSISGARTSRNV